MKQKNKNQKRILSKALYNSYGIMLKESEVAYFDFLLEKNKCFEKSLLSFFESCETRYFKKNKIKEIARNIKIISEVGRNIHTPRGKGAAPDGKGTAGNITDQQLVADIEGLYLEDSVNTMSGKESLYIEDRESQGKEEKDKNNIHVDMEEDYMHIFTRNLRTKNINN